MPTHPRKRAGLQTARYTYIERYAGRWSGGRAAPSRRRYHIGRDRATRRKKRRERTRCPIIPLTHHPEWWAEAPMCPGAPRRSPGLRLRACGASALRHVGRARGGARSRRGRRKRAGIHRAGPPSLPSPPNPTHPSREKSILYISTFYALWGILGIQGYRASHPLNRRADRRCLLISRPIRYR